MPSVLKQLATEEVAGVLDTLEIAPFASFPPHKDYMPMSPVIKLRFRVVPYQEQVLSGRVSLQDRPLKGIGAQVEERRLFDVSFLDIKSSPLSACRDILGGVRCRVPYSISPYP